MLFVAVLRLELTLKFTTPAEKLAVPAPLTEDPALKLKVPPEKLSVAPAAALKPAVSVPPPEKSRVPALAFTAPVLLNATLTVLEIPPVIWKVPALLNVDGVPPLKMMPFPLSFTMVQVAPERLLITAPVGRREQRHAVVGE